MRTLLDFVLDEVLGEGTNAVVHRARRLPGGETVALKCPRHDTEAASAALEREAGLLGRLRHPNVARLIELVRMSDTDPAVAVAIELIDGPSLSELSATTPIEPERLAGVGADVARGLEALHDAGIIHGDVKPANVLIRSTGQAVLVDLDAAVDSEYAPTGSRSIRATTRFAAPEVLERGDRTAASDVWSLAATLLACVGGGEDPPPSTIGELPADLRQILDASLAVDPGDRPTLTQLIDGLDRASSKTARAPATTAQPPSVTAGRHGVGLGAEAATTLAAVPKLMAGAGIGEPGDRRDTGDRLRGGDPTVVWRPTCARHTALPRTPSTPRRSGVPATRGRIGLTLAGVALGAVGAIVLLAWVSDAVRGPRPTLAASPSPAHDPGVEPTGARDQDDARHQPADRDEPEPDASDGAEANDASGSTTLPATPEPLPRCVPDDDEGGGANEGAGPAPGEASSEVRHLHADLRAERCTRMVSWDPVSARATVWWPEGVRRYAFGQPGDQLVLGDWDGDGRATPALYRPSTGETFTFAGWAESDAPLPSAEVQDTGIRDGRPVARTAVPGTADHLIIEEPER